MNQIKNKQEIREYLLSHPEIGVLTNEEISEKLNELGIFNINFNEKWFNNHPEVWSLRDKWNQSGGPSRYTLWRRRKALENIPQPEETPEEKYNRIWQEWKNSNTPNF